MTEVVGVRFKNVGKMYYFSPDNNKIPVGAHVIVETVRGVEMGEVVLANREVEDSSVVQPLKKVLRIATEEDIKKAEKNRSKEEETFAICEKAIAEHGLDMKLVDVEYTFDANKILFYFTADGRIDFRDLVKDLAAKFKTRIELRQIGVRDEAKMQGGLGVCGKEFCCSQFLGEFVPVSIKMAKEQGLSLNPTKISGTCGRLMCCLKYEQDAYEDMIKNMPGIGSYVETPEYKGYVTEVNLLKSIVKVRKEGDESAVPKAYHRRDIKVIKSAAVFTPTYASEMDEE